MTKDYPTTVHCHIHNADTTVGACEKNMPQHFLAGCYFCAWEELQKMTVEFKKVREQRDCLVEAMSIVNIEKKLK